MLNPRRACILSALVALVLAAQAHAFNTAFLRDAPVGLFTKDDLLVFKAAVLQAVAENADGEMLSWQSSDTDSRGEVTPLDTKTVKGATCRRTRIVNHARGRNGEGVYELCQQPDGDWKIVSPAPAN